MKRLTGTLATAVASVVLLASNAMAAQTLYPPKPKPKPTVLGHVVHNPHQATAFTGANIALGLIVLSVLVVAGLVAVRMADRRAAARA